MWCLMTSRAPAWPTGRPRGSRTARSLVRRRRQPLWAFADSQPLARTGAAAITVARLDWATLRRVHTPRDTPDGLAFRTAESVGRLLSGAI